MRKGPFGSHPSSLIPRPCFGRRRRQGEVSAVRSTLSPFPYRGIQAQDGLREDRGGGDFPRRQGGIGLPVTDVDQLSCFVRLLAEQPALLLVEGHQELQLGAGRLARGEPAEGE